MTSEKTASGLNVVSMSIWRDWLPAELAAQVKEKEPSRFTACIRALKAEWDANATKSSADRSQATLPWVSLFKRCGPVLF